MVFDLLKEQAYRKLARRLNWGWQVADFGHGAPEIDPEKPYGNSDVGRDILEMLEIKPDGDEYSGAQREEAIKIHEGMLEYLKKLTESL